MAKKIPQPIDKHVGRRLRLCRLMLGVSRKSSAAKSDARTGRNPRTGKLVLVPKTGGRGRE